MNGVIVALLGSKNELADGVEDYCTCLGQALMKRGYSLKLVRLAWVKVGWVRALRWLWNESIEWRGKWVLIQYTALTWSRKGFPLGLLPILWVLRMRGIRSGIIFHDVTGYPGDGFLDRTRREVQHAIMRYIVRLPECSIFTVEPASLGWLGNWVIHPNVFSIPVGSNIPEQHVAKERCDGFKTIVIFGIDGGRVQSLEIEIISKVVRQAAAFVGPLRLVVLGRGSQEAEPLLRAAFDGTRVRLEIRGLLPVAQVSEVLASADVQLFVRGGVDSRRTTAIAGIVHGLPIVGFASELTGFPITEAGVRLVNGYDNNHLAEALIAVLGDNRLRAELCQRSRDATEKHFSWDVIADRLLRVLYT